jgi:transposase-like protein
MKKQYTASFKVKCVLELLRQEKSLAQLSSETGVHPNQLRNWRAHLLKEMGSLFEKKNQTVELVAAHEKEKEELYAEIGRLTTHLAWLKKIWSRLQLALRGWGLSNGRTKSCRS